MASRVFTERTQQVIENRETGGEHRITFGRNEPSIGRLRSGSDQSASGLGFFFGRNEPEKLLKILESVE